MQKPRDHIWQKKKTSLLKLCINSPLLQPYNIFTKQPGSPVNIRGYHCLANKALLLPNPHASKTFKYANIMQSSFRAIAGSERGACALVISGGSKTMPGCTMQPLPESRSADLGSALAHRIPRALKHYCSQNRASVFLVISDRSHMAFVKCRRTDLGPAWLRPCPFSTRSKLVQDQSLAGLGDVSMCRPCSDERT